MDLVSDASATEAMIQATVQAETCKGTAMLSSDWQSTLADVTVHPSLQTDDLDGECRQKPQSSREGNRSEHFQREYVECELTNCYKKNVKPVKTIPPLAAIKLDSIYLTDRIESL